MLSLTVSLVVPLHYQLLPPLPLKTHHDAVEQDVQKLISIHYQLVMHV